MLDELPGAGLAIRAGEDAGIGGRVEHPVDWRQCLDITGCAEVAVEQPHPEFFQFRPIGFAPRPDEVVESGQFVRGSPVGQRARNRAAHEAADARDKNAHRGQHAKNRRCWKGDFSGPIHHGEPARRSRRFDKSLDRRGTPSALLGA